MWQAVLRAARVSTVPEEKKKQQKTTNKKNKQKKQLTQKKTTVVYAKCLILEEAPNYRFKKKVEIKCIDLFN